MNWNAISAIAELLGAAAVVISLLYLAAQIRQNTRQSRAAAQQAIVHELGNALRAQAQNQEWATLLVRGLNDLDSLTQIEKMQFLSHIGHIFRLYESAYLRNLDGSLDPRFWGGVQRAMADIMSYPGMQAALRLRRHHYSDAFAEFASRLKPLAPQQAFGEEKR